MQSTKNSIQTSPVDESFPAGRIEVSASAVWTEKIGIVRALVRHLREQIITGELAPGEKIIEGRFAANLGISRAPLREALRVLEYEGLVKNIPRKGSRVTSISAHDFIETYQIREMVELYAVDLMREKNIKDFPQLMPLLEKPYGVSMPLEAVPPVHKLDILSNSRVYHYRLVEAAGSRKLCALYRTIYHSIERYQYFYAFSSGIIGDGFDEHKEVVDLLCKGKYGAAKKLLKTHIDFFSGKIKEKMLREEKPQ